MVYVNSRLFVVSDAGVHLPVEAVQWRGGRSVWKLWRRLERWLCHDGQSVVVRCALEDLTVLSRFTHTGRLPTVPGF